MFRTRGHPNLGGWNFRTPEPVVPHSLTFVVSKKLRSLYPEFVMSLSMNPFFRIIVMATTEMESCSSECRSEPGTGDGDSKYPLKVLYCGGKILTPVLWRAFLQNKWGHFKNCFLFLLCSVLSAYRGKVDDHVNFWCSEIAQNMLLFAFLLTLHCDCSTVSTCLSQPNADSGWRRTSQMFLPGWL